MEFVVQDTVADRHAPIPEDALLLRGRDLIIEGAGWII